MFVNRTSVICTYVLLCLIVLCSCSQSSASNPGLTKTPPVQPSKPVVLASPTATSTPKAGGTPDTTPTRYTAHVLLSGARRPDDLVFDTQGRLLFSDFYNGTISRLNPDGSVSTLLSGIAGPEGLVFLPDGTLIIAEQRTNRILSLAPQARSLTMLRTLPGTPSNASCKDGVDGIALDPTTNTLIIPDSPIGNVYRMSLDGKTLSLLASGIRRPVGAAVDPQGNIYIADECGGAIWKIASSGKASRMGGFGMPDDVAFDHQGNILMIDLLPSIHALVRVRLSTGKHEILASRGFIEPQGLVVDGSDNIYVSDDYSNEIVEFKPV